MSPSHPLRLLAQSWCPVAASVTSPAGHCCDVPLLCAFFCSVCLGFLLVCFWSCWVFVATRRLLLQSCRDFPCTSSVVAAHGLSCSAASGISVPWPGIEPGVLALGGSLLTAGPPGKYYQCCLEIRDESRNLSVLGHTVMEENKCSLLVPHWISNDSLKWWCYFSLGYTMDIWRWVPT